MKKNIHPEYVECTISCGCGESWTTRSTVPEIKVEVCSSCHPFFRGGGAKFVDSMGRVDRFQKKFGGKYFDAKKGRKKSTKNLGM